MTALQFLATRFRSESEGLHFDFALGLPIDTGRERKLIGIVHPLTKSALAADSRRSRCLELAKKLLSASLDVSPDQSQQSVGRQ